MIAGLLVRVGRIIIVTLADVPNGDISYTISAHC